MADPVNTESDAEYEDAMVEAMRGGKPAGPVNADELPEQLRRVACAPLMSQRDAARVRAAADEIDRLREQLSAAVQVCDDQQTLLGQLHAEIDRLRDGIRALHAEDYETGPMGTCRTCYSEEWPCATRKLVDGNG